MKTSLKTLASTIVLVIASAATISAFAQTPPPAAGASNAGPGKARHHLKDLDVNKDQMISRDEAKGHKRLEKNFDAIDTNKDGQLSRAELKAYREAHKGEGKGQGKK